MMRFLVVLAVLTASAPAIADEAEKNPPPGTREEAAIPNPIPPDFDECIRVVLSRPAQTELGMRDREFRPPLSADDRATIRYVIERKWGKVERCD